MNHTFQATKEQTEIIKSVLTNKGIHIINAYAGTGKTTILVLLSEAIAQSRKPNETPQKIYYMCFNPSVAREATKLFDHSIVTIGTPLDLAKEVLSSYEIVKDYSIAKIMEMEKLLYSDAYQVSMLLKEYFNSSVSDLTQIDNNDYTQFARDIAQQLVTDMKSHEIDATESFIIHYFQHQIEYSKSAKKYDCMLIDEAQDSSSAIANIIVKYPAEIKCLAGDNNQRIYAFKGTKNVLLLEDAYLHTLSKSFRYGQNISSSARHILHFYKGDDIVLEWTDKGKECHSQAVICYSNKKVMEYIIYCVENNIKFTTFKDPRSIFSLTIDLYNFFNNHGSPPIEIQEIYRSYLEEHPNKASARGDVLKNYIKNNCISDYRGIDKRVYDNIVFFEKYGDMTKYFNIALENFTLRSLGLVTIGTAYDLKGQEFDCVTIAKDFPDIAQVIAKFYFYTKQTHDHKHYNFIEDFRKMIAKKTHYSKELNHIRWLDVVNLYYVAITRARIDCLDGTINSKYISDNIINNQIRKHIRAYKTDSRDISSL